MESEQYKTLWHRESERLQEMMRLYEHSLEMQFRVLAALQDARIELEKEKSITLFQRLFMCCLRSPSWLRPKTN